jgi:hypothetical protein
MEYDNHLKDIEKLKEDIKTLEVIVSTQRETIEAHEATIKHLRRE